MCIQEGALKQVLSSYGSRTGMVRVRGLLDRDEERWVRGTGGVCRSRGDRGVEPFGYQYLDTGDSWEGSFNDPTYLPWSAKFKIPPVNLAPG